MEKPKQKRSLIRTNKILDTAELILDQENLKALTIARISKDAQLKRTSTYKFFKTPEEIKISLVERYIKRCNKSLISGLSGKDNQDYAGCLRQSTEIIKDFFLLNPGAQKLILENTVSPPISSKNLNLIAETILKHTEKTIGLPNMFNKSGVFLVITQIIFSILSLNTKENSSLTDVGINEAVRSANSYLLSCLATEG